MINKIKRLGTVVTMIMAAYGFMMAQEDGTQQVVSQETQTQKATDDWEPIGVWPFIYKNFRTAKVEFGLFSKKENTLPCNIHVGKNALWFSKDNETLLEAISDNVRKVTFENGDVYVPVGTNNMFGKLMYEGELQGKIARVLLIRQVDQRAVDQNYVDYLNKTQNMLQGASGSFFSSLADVNGHDDPDKQPVPLKNVFFFFYNGDMFEATTKNILSHIKPERRREYKNYTRSAEVLSYSVKSMLGVWNDFFVNYEGVQKKKK